MNKEQAEVHLMELVTTDDSGAEEWYCPTCGRRFLMHWPPDYKKTILETGDEYATHSGGKGGISMNPPQVTRDSKDEYLDQYDELEGLSQAAEDEPGLAIWEDWLDKIDFESWWDDAT